MDKDEKKIKDQALQDLPGAATDIADDEKVSEACVRQATKLLNDNPRMDNGPEIFG